MLAWCVAADGWPAVARAPLGAPARAVTAAAAAMVAARRSRIEELVTGSPSGPGPSSRAACSRISALWGYALTHVGGISIAHSGDGADTVRVVRGSMQTTRPRRRRTLEGVPELPEVQALADFLTERAVGHVVARVDLASIAVL